MKLNPYLNFDGNAEEAMTFYKKVFRVDFAGNGMMKMRDLPDADKIPAELHDRVMHVSLPLGDEFVMASDTMPGMGMAYQQGNNSYICISPDTKDEADRLFQELSEGGKVEMPMSQEFYGYFGSFTDRFGTPWMIHFEENSTF